MKDNITDKDLDNLFKERFQEYEIQPSAKVWDSVDSNVLQAQAIKFKKLTAFYKWLSVGLGVVLIAVTVFFIAPKSGENNLTTNIAASKTGQVTAKKETQKTAASSSKITLENQAELLSNSSKQSNSSENSAKSNPKVAKAQMEQDSRKTASAFASEEKRKLRENMSAEITQDKRVKVEAEQLEKMNNAASNSNRTKRIDRANRKEENRLQSIIAAEKAQLLYTPVEKSEDNSIFKITVIPPAINATALNKTLAIDSRLDSANLSDIVAAHNTKFTARISLEGVYSPDFSNRFIKLNGAFHDSEPAKEFYNQNESAAFGYTTGLNIGLDITNRWQVRLGAHYSVFSQHITRNSFYEGEFDIEDIDQFDDDYQSPCFVETSIGYSLFDCDKFDAGKLGSYTVKLKQIHIPIGVKYTILNNKTKIYVHGGVAANILLNTAMVVRHKHTGEDIFFEDIEGLREYYFGLHLGAGIEQPVFKGFSIMAEPIFRTAFTPINYEYPVKTYPYSLGLVTGIRYSF
ncbi:MAG: hypothetical protein COA57_08030 [Flavobacteriales bacterium]|nr:MAG: hypothetical protein COA57_08030 [Flavobacteriales bacterium]